MTATPKEMKYCAIALDPIHIGTGGYQLGRVDNTIVRDPATDVPKIPGTSLAGVIRAYAVIAKEEDTSQEKTKQRFKDVEIDPIFGTPNNQGILRFYDAQILLFPVSSLQGTVWVTTKEIFEYWFGELGTPATIGDNAYILRGIDNSKPLNLGWLIVDTTVYSVGKKIKLPNEINDFVKRVVMVSDKIFSQVINDNLEVRTSVSIDSSTGTAKDGALFTYEAITRGTILGFEVVKDTREHSTLVDSLIEATFPYLKLLGVGGMVTRGFGRIKVFKPEKSTGDINQQRGADSGKP